MLVDELVALDAVEDLQDPGCVWGRGSYAVRGAGCSSVLRCYRGADLAFQERLEGHREEVAEQERFDAMGGIEVDGLDFLWPFEQRVTAFEVGLLAVGGQDFGGRHHGVVADGREVAVGDVVVGDLVGSDLGADREGGFLAAPVAGVVAGAAASFLPERHFGGLGDGEADPTRRTGKWPKRCGRLVQRRLWSSGESWDLPDGQ